MQLRLRQHPASFKDPSGFVFTKDGQLFRHVGNAYAPHYEHLIQSGLYARLTESTKLVKHVAIPENLTGAADFYLTLQPDLIDPISYAYEWSFDQLRDAALLTLSIMRISLSHGMMLKDATPYNIQFHLGKPIFIDSLSFEKHDPSEPWVAYKQFCEMFLNPLLLHHYLGVNAMFWLRSYLTGIPASTTATLLPRKAYWNLSVWLHVILPGKIKNRPQRMQQKANFSLQKMQQLIQHLESTLQKLRPAYARVTTWNQYYTHTILGKEYLSAKESLVLQLLQEYQNQTILDLGANDGHFSILLSKHATRVIATDMDEACIHRLYQTIKEQKITNIYPIVQQLANPSPAIGFHQKERNGFIARCQSNIILALALIHHLSIGENIPLQRLADFFADLGPTLLIEFVPKEDEKVQQMLSARKDIFDNYNETEFERAFQTKYQILHKKNIPGTYRTLYLMQRN